MRPFNRVTPFLATRNISDTVAFYRDILGFRVETLHPADSPTLAILDNGGASLIFDSSLWTDPPSLTGQIHFDVAPGDVMEIHEKLKSRTEILWGPEVYAYGRREFSCRDPNGYALVFSEQTSDPATCREDQ